MPTEPMTAVEWAEHLKRKATRTGLTEDELKLWLLINCNDRLVEIQVGLEDLAGRVQQIDVWLEATAPGYRTSKPRDSSRMLPIQEAVDA